MINLYTVQYLGGSIHNLVVVYEIFIYSQAVFKLFFQKHRRFQILLLSPINVKKQSL